MTNPIIKTPRELLDRLNQLEELGCVPWTEFKKGVEVKEFGAWRCAAHENHDCCDCGGSYTNYVAVGFPKADGSGHFPCALVISQEAWWQI